MRITWEKTSDGHSARRHEAPSLGAPHVQPFAWQAFTDVSRLHTSFSGIATTFVPTFTLLAKHCHFAAGWSLLRCDSTATEGTSLGPDLCLRTCKWDNARAQRELTEVDSTREYVGTSLPLQCTIRFLCSEQLPVAPLTGQTSQVLTAGVRFERRERVDQGGEIEFRFCDGLQNFRFSYFPATSTCPRLEGLFAEWHAWFEKARECADVVPDEGCAVSYRESVWERLDRYK